MKIAKRIITIDDYAFDNGKIGIQDERIASHNKQKSIMMSSSDWYNGRFSNKALASIRQDAEESYVLLSDRNFYNARNLNVRIVNHYNSKVVKPASLVVEAPVFSGEKIEKVLSQSKGREYMQARFGTKDNQTKMISRFEELSNVEKEDIFIYTLNIQSRRSTKSDALHSYPDRLERPGLLYL